jgi:catechol 2,3-dioxygenase-like lactoylglutathione lyase family enzyme
MQAPARHRTGSVSRPLRSAAVVVALLFIVRAPARTSAQTPLVTRVATVGFTVSDLDRTIAFFHDVLGFETLGEHEVAGRPFELLQGVFGLRARVATLSLGDETLELTEYLAPAGRPIPPNLGSNDRSFQHVAIIVSDMDRAYARLRAARVRHGSSGPQTLPASIPAAAGIRAFYFRDPDGHFLEVLQFPPDKGAAKWHRTDALFLGIDHTAIVVADTDVSLALYRDALGLSVAGTSENAGVEQEHLNNVFGARLRITTLRALSGPGIELLEYLAPGDGRPGPADLRASDLLHWQTTLVSADVKGADAALARAGASRVSPGPVEIPDETLGFRTGALLRDRDGHALRVVNSDLRASRGSQ